MNKQIIAGIIFIIIWVVVMLVWGGYKMIRPDLSSDYESTQGVEGDGNGHPLWR